jgi:hypothetical protein
LRQCAGQSQQRAKGNDHAHGCIPIGSDAAT